MTETLDLLILHRARLAAKRSLNDLASPRVSRRRMLRAMDSGQFDRLPAGLYARAYVRSVASALGLDPEATLAELLPVLPRSRFAGRSGGGRALASRGRGEPPKGDEPAIPAAASWSSGHDDEWRRFGGTLVDGLALLAMQLLIAVLAAVAAGVGLGQLRAVGLARTATVVARHLHVVFRRLCGRERSDARRPAAVACGRRQGTRRRVGR